MGRGSILTQTFQWGAVFTRGFDWQVPFQFPFASNSTIRPLLTIIITIIVELREMRGQPPSLLVLGDWILGTQDILSWGPVAAHWRHVYICSVRYIFIRTRFESYSLHRFPKMHFSIWEWRNFVMNKTWVLESFLVLEYWCDLNNCQWLLHPASISSFCFLEWEGKKETLPESPQPKLLDSQSCSLSSKRLFRVRVSFYW